MSASAAETSSRAEGSSMPYAQPKKLLRDTATITGTEYVIDGGTVPTA